MGIRIDIVTAERLVFSDEADIVIVPGVDGEMGILPHHEPIMTMIKPGEVLVKKGTEEYILIEINILMEQHKEDWVHY